MFQDQFTQSWPMRTFSPIDVRQSARSSACTSRWRNLSPIYGSYDRRTDSSRIRRLSARCSRIGCSSGSNCNDGVGVADDVRESCTGTVTINRRAKRSVGTSEQFSVDHCQSKVCSYAGVQEDHVSVIASLRTHRAAPTPVHSGDVWRFSNGPAEQSRANLTTIVRRTSLVILNRVISCKEC